jgi:hypothetical protein
MNHRGYSRKFIEANRKADQRHIGVVLGRICINRDIPIKDVSEHLSVSRQVLYLWFLGKSRPQPAKQEMLEELVRKLRENE